MEGTVLAFAVLERPFGGRGEEGEEGGGVGECECGEKGRGSERWRWGGGGSGSYAGRLRFGVPLVGNSDAF